MLKLFFLPYCRKRTYFFLDRFPVMKTDCRLKNQDVRRDLISFWEDHFKMEIHSILENFNFICFNSPCKFIFVLYPFFLFILRKVAIATQKLLIISLSKENNSPSPQQISVVMKKDVVTCNNKRFPPLPPTLLSIVSIQAATFFWLIFTWWFRTSEIRFHNQKLL